MIGSIPAPNSYREIVARESCTAGDIDLQIEEGAAVSQPCLYWLLRLVQQESDYTARWGTKPLQDGTWHVRLVTHIDADIDVPSGHYIAGLTMWGAHTIDLVRVTSFAHEMHHVDLGPGSADHAGWCPTFTDWERATPSIAIDDSYLCP